MSSARTRAVGAGGELEKTWEPRAPDPGPRPAHPHAGLGWGQSSTIPPWQMPAWGGGKAAPSPPWQDAGLCPDSGQPAKLWQACSAPAAWCPAISCPLPATVIIPRVVHPACMESALPVPVGPTQQGCGPGRGFCLQSSPEPSRRQGEHRILLVLQPCAKEPWVPGGVRAERK